jgi:ectoine hydroxylase-related dioxygenase (phytanoyl-CoA dioxygenase family)|tara:strand:+ start:554 stop:1354 length:801 start_codon:yes stop_codon:yes gene_type:complete
MDTIEHLKIYGYAVEKNVIPIDECKKMSKACEAIKIKKQKESKLFENSNQSLLFNVHLENPDIFLNNIDIPQVMDIQSKVLKEEFILSNFHATHSSSKCGSRVHQDVHIPITDFDNTFSMVAIFCLDDFTTQNGSTFVWPFSHKSGVNPRSYRDKPIEGGLQVSAPRGSIIYILGQTWHDVGPNLDGSSRWGIVAYYQRWWVKPDFDFTQCGSEIYSKLTNPQKKLMGFTTRPPINGDKQNHTLIPVENLPQEYDKALSFVVDSTK